MSLRDEKGFILIASYLAILVLLILSTAFLTRSINEKKLAERERDSIQAFWLAEAGVDRALTELKNNYGLSGDGLWPTSLGQGQYSVNISASGNERTVISRGFIPSISSPLAERVIEVVIRKDIPTNFYDNVLTVATKLEIKENYAITGDPDTDTGNMIYGGTYEDSGSGTITDSAPINDPSVSPLPLLDFEQLHSISSGQGNVYDEVRLEDVEDGVDSFPASFWYDEANAIPNVVFVQSDLEIKESFGIIGGFIIVVGDVLTDPESTGSTELKGDGIIEGCIYATGKFEVEGGDISGISINGSIWVGEDAEIKGNTTLTYDETYMQAIGGLDLHPGAQIVSWREV